jgi:hypothetical protein
LEIEHIFDESITDLRPKFNKVDSYVKACEQVENMEKEFISLISKKKILRTLFYLFSLDEQQAKSNAKDILHASRDVNLAPITEDEELPAGNIEDDDRPNPQQQRDDEEVKNLNQF